MSNTKFVYVVNEYVGGCPMDSQCHGVFTTLEKAKKYYNSYLLELQTNDETLTEALQFTIGADSCFWDLDDLWGGLEITAVKLNR